LARVGFVPTRDTGGFKVGCNLRPVPSFIRDKIRGSYRTKADAGEDPVRGRVAGKSKNHYAITIDASKAAVRDIFFIFCSE
jgi:hypothetical protein